MGNRRKWLINIVFLVITLAVTAFAVLHEEDPKMILLLLDMANGWYWIGALCLVGLFISCESLILRILLNHVGCAPRKGHCLIYSFIGFFFSCITPAAGGGQPAQIYYMHRDGVDPGVSAPILVEVTIAYKMVLVLFGLIILIVRPAELALINDAAIIWCVAGWALNALAVMGFSMLIFWPKLVEKVGDKLLDLTGGFGNRERLERWHQRLDRSVENYHDVTASIRDDFRLFFMVFIISIVQRCLMFSVTWVVLMSYGFTRVSMPTIVLLQSMVSLGTDMLPLPGSTGANEALFLLLFTEICGDLLVLPVLIASRGISYYGQLIICGIVFLLFGSRLGKKKKR